MKNEDKIVELLSEMVQKQDITNAEMKSMGEDIKGMKEDMKGMKKEIHKLNIGMSENTRAIIKLADNLEEMSDHDKRIKALEKVVFKK
jgi:septal ring factor EnvC (AmiA/AmiB activator)